MKGIKPTSDEIAAMQSYYDDNHTAREVAQHFGRFHGTVLKYIVVRKARLSEEERTRRRSARVVSWRQRTKQKLVNYKGGKCQVCGYNRWIGNLAFHHLDPDQKDFTITGKSISFDRLRKEVDKCALLCHICHGEVHAGLISI